ncbi:MAG: ParB/RepB/Spo0J family partition protein [Succinivibrio sp.]
MAGLGRGLNSLINLSNTAKTERDNSVNNSVSAVEEIKNTNNENGIVNISLSELKASAYQPRKSFDEESINELAQSVKEHGLLEPLLVKRIPDSNLYEIICGERRYRACKLAKLDKIPCIVRDDLELNGYAVALIENIQREDLNPVELANAFSLMISECSLTQEELAKTLGKSRSTVTNILRINNLHEEIKKMIVAHQIDLGHAKVILSLEDKELQLKAALYVVKHKLTVRKTEDLVKKLQSGNMDSLDNKSSKYQNENFKNWESMISSSLEGVKVKISASNDERGKITLSYSSKEQLDNLISYLSADKK